MSRTIEIINRDLVDAEHRVTVLRREQEEYFRCLRENHQRAALAASGLTEAEFYQRANHTEFMGGVDDEAA